MPCTGVGRHINNIVTELARRDGVSVEMLFSSQYLTSEKRLPDVAPLSALPFTAHKWSERFVERSWKALGWPTIDRHLDGFDLLYSPSDVVFPRCQIPTLVTLHDIHPLDPLYSEYRKRPRINSQQHRWSVWVPKLFARSTVVCTVSEFSKRRMEELVDTKGKHICVVGNGVEPLFYEIFNEDKQNCLKPGTWPYVIVVGGLTNRKGGEDVIEVARRLGQDRSEIRVVVVGKSEDRLEAAAKSIPNIILAGPVADIQLAHYLRGSLGLLFLSRYEGFGIPILEAMAAGVPAIVADTTSLPEIAGRAGYVVSSKDVTQIALYIESFLHESEELQSRVSLGRARAAEFTWRACCERLQKAIDLAIRHA